ncbi:MAG: hypothetical protein ACRC50_11740 [Gaiella sp.]
MIVRLLLWRLDDAGGSFEEVRAALDDLTPLDPPSAWLWNEAQERFGALVAEDEGDLALPEQIEVVRALLGRDPDLYDEFDVLG